MSRDKSVEIFNKVMEIALEIPAVKVDRETFLKSAFSEYCTKEQITQIIEQNPRAILELDLLDLVAKNVIKVARIEVTAVSAVSGVAGNPVAMAGFAITDMAQYVCFCLNLCQKLAYIYGFPNLMQDGKLTPNSINILTPLLAVMFGVTGMNKLISYLSKALATQVARRVPVIAFGRTAWYVLVKQVAKWIGLKMSKQLFAKTASKLIPALGALISGAITYAAFGPSAKKLAEKLRYNSNFFQDVVKTAKSFDVDAEFEELSKNKEL